MSTCLVCLRPARGQAEYHPRCLESLFGTKKLPRLDLELRELFAAAAAMAGKMSVSGVQEKISLALSADRERLVTATTGGRFLLKPESLRFSALPQNEHLTMRLAGLVGIETPPCGLVRLKGGEPAYLVRRFDRLADGTKLAVEDFCQLSELSAEDKYRGSAEGCVRILRSYATAPAVEIRRLFELLVFGWWTSNGDMHLKNLSLLTRADGSRVLSPAYDLVCTRLVIPDDDAAALAMGGRNKKFTRARWLEFAAYCKLPPAVAERILADLVQALPAALDLVGRSLLPPEQQAQYEAILRERTAILAAPAP